MAGGLLVSAEITWSLVARLVCSSAIDSIRRRHLLRREDSRVGEWRIERRSRLWRRILRFWYWYDRKLSVKVGVEVLLMLIGVHRTIIAMQ